MSKRKMLIINENTVIKLYEAMIWEAGDTLTISAMIVDKIIEKLTKAKADHPLKDLYLDEENKAPFYELVHFVYTTVEDYEKIKLAKKLDKKK